MKVPHWIPLVASMAASSLLACANTTDGTGQPPGGNPQGNPPNYDGVPCDVADVLNKYCTSCHGSPPAGGAPMSIVSYDDLVRPSISDPARTVAEVSVDRMRNPAQSMPPGSMLADAAIAPLEAWVAAGMPPGDCTNPSTVELVCTSNTFWQWGDEPPNEAIRDQMNPGMECISCHQDEAAENPLDPPPAFLIAGTLYPTVREPDLCFGAPSAVVEVTDANGHTVSMTTNATGNFYYEGAAGSLVPPFSASVTFDGATVAMQDPVDTGDCNSCHTQDGAEGAPGRIHLP